MTGRAATTNGTAMADGDNLKPPTGDEITVT
jgi:hypothetical protein